MKYVKAGFTLIEIMIVVTILGILTGLAVQQYTRYQRQATETRTEAELQALSLDISQYRNHTGQYPTGLQDLAKRPSDPAISQKWRGPYVEGDEVRQDPWGEDYQYERKPKGSKPPYELYSYGSKKEEADPSEYLHVPGQ